MFRNAYLLLVLTTLFWGGNAVAGKLAVGHISPMMLSTLRWGLAALLMLAIGHAQLRRDWHIVRRHLPLLFALSAAGFAFFNSLLYLALTYTTAINVSVEQAAMPMLIFAANYLLYRTRVTWAQIVGFVLSLIGVALTASHGSLAGLLQLDVNVGDALMMLALVLYAGFTVALRYKPDIDWRSLMLVMCVATFLISVPLALWEFAAGATIVPDARGWAIVVYTAVFAAILGQAFYIRSVELIGGNRAGLFVNLMPIFGTLMSILILGETFHLYHAVALVLVFGGIWIAERSSRKQAK